MTSSFLKECKGGHPLRAEQHGLDMNAEQKSYRVTLILPNKLCSFGDVAHGNDATVCKIRSNWIKAKKEIDESESWLGAGTVALCPN